MTSAVFPWKRDGGRSTAARYSARRGDLPDPTVRENGKGQRVQSMQEKQTAQNTQKIIDAHVHIYPEAIADRATESLGRFYQFTVHAKGTYEDLERQALSCGVSGFFLLAVATNAHQVQKVNDHVVNAMQTARRHGLECYAFAGMHQDYPDFAAEIERCRALGFTGFKIHPDIQRMDLLSSAMYALCEALEGNMPLFLHMGDCRAEYRFSEPEKLVTLTRRFPRLQVVAAHYGGYQAWDDAVHCLAGVPNVWFDCSSALWAMTPERAYALTETMGFDRVMYGSDYPVYGLADYLELFLRVPFSPAQRSAILYDNAQRFLHACGAL